MTLTHGVHHDIPEERECKCGGVSKAKLVHFVENELLVFQFNCTRKNCKWSGYSFAGNPLAIDAYISRLRPE
jgi:hypothetical protein